MEERDRVTGDVEKERATGAERMRQRGEVTGGETGKGREGETERRGPRQENRDGGKERGRFRARGQMCQSRIHRERDIGNQVRKTTQKMWK